jgi:hypothetical protein
LGDGAAGKGDEVEGGASGDDHGVEEEDGGESRLRESDWGGAVAAGGEVGGRARDGEGEDAAVCESSGGEVGVGGVEGGGESEDGADPGQGGGGQRVEIDDAHGGLLGESQQSGGSGQKTE